VNLMGALFYVNRGLLTTCPQLISRVGHQLIADLGGEVGRSQDQAGFGSPFGPQGPNPGHHCLLPVMQTGDSHGACCLHIA